jgi:uncharacterized membrane protein YkvA (DUF1232 family)
MSAAPHHNQGHRDNEAERGMERVVLEGEILGPESEASRAGRVKKRFWPTLKRAIRQIPFAENVVAAYYCAFDPATPPRVRAVLLGALAYFVLPFDVLPDLLAGIGFSDDASVLLLAIGTVAAHITPAHREAAKRALADPDAA